MEIAGEPAPLLRLPRRGAAPAGVDPHRRADRDPGLRAANLGRVATSRCCPASAGCPPPARRPAGATPKVRPADYFDLDLTVDAARGLAGRRAGPAAMTPAARVAGCAIRFAPPAPVPEVALLAGRFESSPTEVDGVQVEMLVDDSHVANAEFFADAAGEIGDWLSERLTEADELGLPYPYDGLTMVEVPMALRGYGGGWRMDSTMIQPAMVLMRESELPHRRLRAAVRGPGAIPRRRGRRAAGQARARALLRERLQRRQSVRRRLAQLLRLPDLGRGRRRACRWTTSARRWPPGC